MRGRVAGLGRGRGGHGKAGRSLTPGARLPTFLRWLGGGGSSCAIPTRAPLRRLGRPCGERLRHPAQRRLRALLIPCDLAHASRDGLQPRAGRVAARASQRIGPYPGARHPLGRRRGDISRGRGHAAQQRGASEDDCCGYESHVAMVGSSHGVGRRARFRPRQGETRISRSIPPSTPYSCNHIVCVERGVA
jgi:hypothetical protein